MARSPGRSEQSAFADEWASPYRAGQMRSSAQHMQNQPSQGQPHLPTADHSAHRRRRGGGAGGETSSPNTGYVRTTPPRARAAPLKSSPGRPPTMAGQRDYTDSPSGLGATLGSALNGALGSLDPNAVRPISPVKGDIAPGDESQVAAHEFRGLWKASEKNRQKAELECSQCKRENEQLKNRLATLEQRLRGTLESSGGAKSQLRDTQTQLQGLEQELSQLRLEHMQLQRDNEGLRAARDEQAHKLRATEDALSSEQRRAATAESALSTAEGDRRHLAETQRQTAAELAAAASGSQQASEEAKRQIETERLRASTAAAASAEQLATQENELARVRDEALRVRDEAAQYAQALGTTQQREAELQRQLDAVKGQMSNLHHDLAVKEAEVAAANEGRHKLEAAAATAQGSLEAARRDHAGAISERGQLEAALATERESTRRERENADRAREKRRGLEEQLRRVEGGAEAARREAAAARQEAVAAKEQQAIAEKEASSHAASLLASRTELRESRDAKENAEDIAARLREQLDAAKREAAEQRSLAEQSTAALVERETELSALQREEEELRCLQQDEAQRLHRQGEALAASETMVQQLRNDLNEETSARGAEQEQAEADRRLWEDQRDSMTREQTALADRLSWTTGRLEELAALQLELEEIAIEQRSLSDELAMTRQDCGAHEVQLQELTMRLATAEEQRDEAVDARQTAERATGEWQDKHAAAADAERTAIEAMTASANEVAQLRTDAERTKVELNSSTASAAHANEKVEELQKQIMAQQTEWHERERAEHTAHSTRLAEAESARKLAEDQLKHAEEQSRQTKSALDSVQTANQQCRDEITRISQQHLAAEAQVRDLAHAKVVLEDSLQSSKQAALQAEASASQLHVKVQEAEARAAASESSAVAAQKDHDAAEKELKAKWETCQGEMARLRGVAVAAEAEKRTAEQEATRARATATGEAGRRAAAEQRAASAEAAAVLSEAANATVEKELAEATKRWETALSEEAGKTGMVMQSESQLREVVASERAGRRSAEAALVASEQRSKELEARLTESCAEIAAQAQLLEEQHTQENNSGAGILGADAPAGDISLVSREEFASLISDWKMANNVLEKMHAERLQLLQTEAELREALAVAQHAAQAAAAAAAAVPALTGPDPQTVQRLESLQAELHAAQESQRHAVAAEEAACKRCFDEVTEANVGKNAVVSDM